jgi:hypothetical protein
MNRTPLLVLLTLAEGFHAGCGDDATSLVDASHGTSQDASPAVDSEPTRALDSAASIDAQIVGGLDSGGVVGLPATPANLSVAPGNAPGTAIVSFLAPALDAGFANLTFTVNANPGAITATGTAPPITVTGLLPQTAYTFSVITSDGVASSAPATTGLLGFYDVVETFREPMTQPNDTVFTGSFTFDLTTEGVSNLAGSLTESMTKVNGVYGGPMTTVSLANQLSSVPVALDGANGLLVTTFALTTTDTFTGGGFAPGGTEYYGVLKGIQSNHNAYAMIFVNATDPTAPATQAQIDKLAYADCTAGGMMMKSCMTGTSVNGYGADGTMGGYPLSQVITRR